MAAAYLDLYLDRGSSYNTTITLTDDITGNVVNIANYIINSKIRQSYYSANATETFVCTINDAANGIIGLSLSVANTLNLKPGKYVYDVVAINTANVTARILEGKVIVTPFVSY